ncbi:MAG: SRPBCC domain-containing protein [Pseudonocardiaceae bacterium]|nr:MAG: SRPBCC domain-containing protein [Pseudonocardiaceae bacterium]
MPDRELRKEIALDATPEQVWEAIATGPGIATWFVPHRVEERKGGTMSADFGGGFADTGRVTAWDPVRRFASGALTPPEEGKPDYAFEFLVEARDGGGAVLRFVQSGFLDGTEWDDEYGSYDAGWGLFLLNLQQYFAHFAGLPVANVVTMAWADGGASTLWPVLLRSLGLDARPAVGDTITLRPNGIVPVTGVVDVVTDEFLGVRSERGLHRIGAEGEAGCGVSAYHYFYGDPAPDTVALTGAWQSWLEWTVPLKTA